MKTSPWIILFFLSAPLLLPVIMTAQSSPEEIISRFFQDFEQKGPSEALDALYATNPWISRNADAVENLKTQLEGLTEDYVGQNHGYEQILSRKLTEHFRLVSFLVRYDRQPIRFTFQFYRPADQWRVHSFQFDARIEEEFEQSAGLQHLHPENR